MKKKNHKKNKKEEEFKKEVDEIFSTDNIEERIQIFQKYHPDDNRFKGEIKYEK